jgi:MFS family permease
MRVGLGEPIGALGILLAVGVGTSVLVSAATGRVLPRVHAGRFLAASVAACAVALAGEALAPSLWVIGVGFAVFGVGFGAIDAGFNAFAASHFGARQINWMHASYGLGATIGPLLVTALLGAGLDWRWAYGAMAVVHLGVAVVFLLARRNWDQPAGTAGAVAQVAAVALEPAANSGQRGRARAAQSAQGEQGRAAEPAQGERALAAEPAQRQRVRAGAMVGALSFVAVEAGIEAGAGIWGFVFLTSGRGLSGAAAGLAISAYWATMFAGRVVLGPVAERVGASRVLTWAVAGVALGAALMALPGPAVSAVAGLMIFGLAAAPIFPLFTVTTGQRLGASNSGTTHAVGLQVAASAAGSAALPAGLGLAIGALGAGVAAPLLLALSLGMCGLHGFLIHGRPSHAAG